MRRAETTTGRGRWLGAYCIRERPRQLPRMLRGPPGTPSPAREASPVFMDTMPSGVVAGIYSKGTTAARRGGSAVRASGSRAHARPQERLAEVRDEAVVASPRETGYRNRGFPGTEYRESMRRHRERAKTLGDAERAPRVDVVLPPLWRGSPGSGRRELSGQRSAAIREIIGDAPRQPRYDDERSAPRRSEH